MIIPGRGGMGGRGSNFEGVLKVAPFLGALLLLIVVAAVIRNVIDSRSDPSAAPMRYDPTLSFGRANARGMASLIMKRPGKETDRSASADGE